MRKKKHDESGGHERWLVSYADFITLLFALFVVLFATSQQDKSMPARVAEAVREALEHGRFDGSRAGKGQTQVKNSEAKQNTEPANRRVDTEDLAAAYEKLKRELSDDIARGQVEIVMQPRGLVISFKQAAVFPSGEDAISPAAYATIGKVAAAISAVRNPVRLEGHTDSLPIHTARFPSNWQLSAARSIALMDYLADRHGLPRERMSVAGYAEVAPMADNSSEGGRAQNRRVDVVVLNEKGSVSEPGYREKDRSAQGGAPPRAGRPPSS